MSNEINVTAEQATDATIQPDTTIIENNTDNNDTSAEASKPNLLDNPDVINAIKSSSSKAKNEILKALGITSVDEFTNIKGKYEQLTNDVTTKNNSITELTSQNKLLSEQLLVSKLGVDSNLASDFLTLAATRVTDNITLEDACNSVLETYPHFLANKSNATKSNSVKIGSEKNNTDKSVELTGIERQFYSLNPKLK